MNAIIISLLLATNSFASSVLWNHPETGEQSVSDLGPIAKLCDHCSVVWDERKDGPMPADAPVGYAERIMVEVEEPGPGCKNAKEIEKAMKEGEEKPECEPEMIRVQKPRLRGNSEMRAAKESREAERAAKEAEREQKKNECAAVRERFKSGRDSEADIRRAVLCWLVN